MKAFIFLIALLSVAPRSKAQTKNITGLWEGKLNAGGCGKTAVLLNITLMSKELLNFKSERPNRIYEHENFCRYRFIIGF